MASDNQRLRCYNATPQLYRNLGAITADLDHIAAMKFNTLWLNPVFETCASIPDYIPNQDSKPGSPYAQRSMNIDKRYSNHPELPDEARRKADYADVRKLTNAARAHGIRPMVDLVLNHVSIDNAMVDSKATVLPGADGNGTVTLDTSKWFKRHASTGAIKRGRLGDAERAVGDLSAPLPPPRKAR
jgi:glycosidase